MAKWRKLRSFASAPFPHAAILGRGSGYGGRVRRCWCCPRKSSGNTKPPVRQGQVAISQFDRAAAHSAAESPSVPRGDGPKPTRSKYGAISQDQALTLGNRRPGRPAAGPGRWAGRPRGRRGDAHSAAAAAVEGVRSHPQLIHADRQTAQHISRCLRPPNSAGSKQWRAAAAALRALTTTLRLAARRSGLPQRRPAASIPQSPWPGAALRWDSSTALRRERS